MVTLMRGWLTMSELHSKNGDSTCLSVNVLKNLAYQETLASKHQRKNPKSKPLTQGWVAFCKAIHNANNEQLLTAIAFIVYIAMINITYYGFFGTFDYVEAASNILGNYYFVCALSPITSMLLIASHYNSKLTAFSAAAYFVLLVYNVLMGIDAYNNLVESEWIYLLDDIIQSASITVLVSIIAFCMMSRVVVYVSRKLLHSLA